MRLFRADIHGEPRVGLLLEGRAVLLRKDLGAAVPPRGFADLADLIPVLADASGAEAIPRRARDGEEVELDKIRLLSPIGRFRRDVLCTGWNYWDHFAEGLGKRNAGDDKRPEAPTFFTKSPNVVIGPTDPIAFDARISSKWDYEGELVVIIGKAGRSIPASRAMDHVFGYCLANDVSARDLQRRHGGQWLKGKSIDGTMPLGPYLVTREEIDLDEVRLECFVNGEKRQDAMVSQMAFPVPELIAELSFGMSLQAGDVLLTGTPAGVGFARTPPLYLKPGDEVVVRGSGLGELRNVVTETNLYGDATITIER